MPVLDATADPAASIHPVALPARYGVADMFCGAGGLSLGFQRTGRFAVGFGCDIKPEAVETFQANHRGGAGDQPDGFVGDIGGLDHERVRGAFPETGDGSLACLIGGPPCEGFSQNRSVNAGGLADSGPASRVHKFVDDPRNHLFRYFVDLAANLRPPVVLIENVPDLVRHREGQTREDILDALREAGYVTSVRVLNAANFGAPQIRRRAFFLAQREEDARETGLRLAFPEPTHSPLPFVPDAGLPWYPGDSGYWPSVREAIGDLPEPCDKGGDGWIDANYPGEPASELRRWLRGGGRIANHIARPLGEKSLAKVRELEAGTERANPRQEEGRVRKYHYSYARLRWNEPARTITKFVYHAGSGMFTHPEIDRPLTMREAARLQTFPDDFRFHSDNIRELSSLVGSAVPPLLGYRLAQQILRYLDALSVARMAPEVRAALPVQTTDKVMRALEAQEWRCDSSRAEQLPLMS